jgi:hypothetical protein
MRYWCCFLAPVGTSIRITINDTKGGYTFFYFLYTEQLVGLFVICKRIIATTSCFSSTLFTNKLLTNSTTAHTAQPHSNVIIKLDISKVVKTRQKKEDA